MKEKNKKNLQIKTALVLGILIFIMLTSYVFAQTILIKSNIKIKDANFYLTLGNFLMKNKYEEHALTAYKKALEVEPNNKNVLNNLGYYFKEKNPLLAEDYFKKALEIDPDYEKARNNLALLYNKNAQYDKAVEQLKYLVEKYPENIHYNYDLAINLANKYYYQSKDYNELSESIKYFKIVYDKDKNFQHVLENIKVLEEIRRMYD
ncbi:MAG: tetratricopeptide repeat protein [Candidatus Woesearchaeota archaeon]